MTPINSHSLIMLFQICDFSSITSLHHNLIQLISELRTSSRKIDVFMCGLAPGRTRNNLIFPFYVLAESEQSFNLKILLRNECLTHQNLTQK